MTVGGCSPMPNILDLDELMETVKQQREQGVIIAQRLANIEAAIQVIASKHTTKDQYTTKEFGQIVGTHPQTIRQHCINRRISAKKLEGVGRGSTDEWRISHQELVRYQNHGLLPA